LGPNQSMEGSRADLVVIGAGILGLAAAAAVVALAREGYRRRDLRLREAWNTLSYPGFHRFARRHWRTGLGLCGAGAAVPARAERRRSPPSARGNSGAGGHARRHARGRLPVRLLGPRLAHPERPRRRRLPLHSRSPSTSPTA